MGPQILLGRLSDGSPWVAVITVDCIGIRVDDMAHLVHPSSMTRNTVQQTVIVAEALLDQWSH